TSILCSISICSDSHPFFSSSLGKICSIQKVIEQVLRLIRVVAKSAGTVAKLSLTTTFLVGSVCVLVLLIRPTCFSTDSSSLSASPPNALSPPRLLCLGLPSFRLDAWPLRP